MDQGPWTFQSSGYCQKTCVDQGYPVMGTQGSNCWCGKLLPAANSKVSDSKCNLHCDGFPKDTCKPISRPHVFNLSKTANFMLGGGQDTWSVQLTGVDNSVGSVQDSDSSSSSSSSDSSSKPATSNPPAAATPSPDTSKNSPPSVVTKASTVVVTAPGQTKASVPSETVTSNSKGSNKAGIAAGIIVGILAVGAVIGGLFFFLRNRKRRALEEEFHRQSANSAAARGQPTSMSSMSDSRLEPSVMMQRRQSDGSIADYHDYSRRILKVSEILSNHLSIKLNYEGHQP